MNKIIFLGYGRSETRIIDELEKKDCAVIVHNERISLDDVDDSHLIVSFGYLHLLGSDFINNCGCPIVNLHISYLPFNRGAHPNFWSFYDGTQSGVSIHLIDEGIDTGPILFQKKIQFEDEKTFIETYDRLFDEIENLFIENIDLIVSKKWTAMKQVGKGTFHSDKDLPNEFNGWQSSIADEIKRLKNLNKIRQ